MNRNEMIKAAEAVIFSSGEPIAVSRLAEVFELGPKETEKLVSEVIEHVENSDLGFRIIKLDDHIQIASKKEYGSYIKPAFDIKRRAPLSPAALEVLAVVAYNQPVTKAFIEQVRGVDCSGVVSTLQEKELIEEDGRLDLPGRPIAFKTTANFLRAFGLSGLDMLPALPSEASVQQLAAPLEAALIKSEDEAEVLEEAEQTEEN